MKKPTVKLIGADGNAFLIIAKVVSALRKAKFPVEQIDQYKHEAMSGDYNNLLRVTDKYVTIK